MARDPNDLFADVPETEEPETGLFDDVPEAEGDAGVFEDLPEAQPQPTKLDRDIETVRNIAQTKGLSEVGRLTREGKIRGLSALAMAQDPNAPRQDNGLPLEEQIKQAGPSVIVDQFLQGATGLQLEQSEDSFFTDEQFEQLEEERGSFKGIGARVVGEGIGFIPVFRGARALGLASPVLRQTGQKLLTRQTGRVIGEQALTEGVFQGAKLGIGEAAGQEITTDKLVEAGTAVGAVTGLGFAARALAPIVRRAGGKVSKLIGSLRKKETARDALRQSGLSDTEIDNLLVRQDTPEEIKDIIRAGDSRTEAGIENAQVRGIADELTKIDETDPLTVGQRLTREPTGDIPKRKDGFNIRSVSDTDEAMKIINNLSKELKPKTPQTFEQMRARALRFGVELEEVKHLGQSIETVSDKLAVAEGMLRSASNDFDGFMKTIEKQGGKLSADQSFELAERITSLKILGDSVKEGRSSLGRATGRLREAGRIERVKDQLSAQLAKRIKKKNGEIDQNVLRVWREVDWNNPAELFSLVDDLTKTRWERTKDGISTYFISNVLYGMKTWLVNPIGNSIQFFARESDRPLSGALNRAISGTARALGRDLPQDRFASETLEIARSNLRDATNFHGIKQGLTETAAMVYRGLKTGKSQFIPASKVDFGQIGRQTPRVLSSPTSRTPVQAADGILTGSLRVLNVQDDLFKLMNYRTHINAIAPRRAWMEATKKGQKLTRSQLNDEVRRIINDADHPLHESVHTEAIEQTLKGVFQDPAGPLSKLALKARRELPGGWLLRLFPLTFVNTPIKLAARGLERTPLGFMKTAVNVGGKKLSGQPISLGEVTDDLAAAINGSFLMYAAYEAVDNGWITGRAPTNPSEREAWELAGNKPYSINIGDMNIEYIRFDPVSFAVGFATDLIQDYQKGINLMDANEVIGSVGLAFSNNFASKTYAKNVGEMMEGINSRDPDRMMNTISRIGSNVAGGFIPFSGMIGNVLRSDNPEQIKIDSFADGLKRRAGMEMTHKIVHDLYGEPKYSQLDTVHEFSTRVINAAVPSRITRDDTSELTQELVRIGVREAVTPLQKDIKNLPMSHDEYNRLNQIMSEVSRPALNALVNNDEAGFDSLVKIMKTPKGSWGDARRKARKAIRDYQRAGEEPQFINGKVTTKKADVVSKVITRYRSYARDIMEPQVIERLKNEGFTDREIALAQKGEIELEDYRR